MKTDLQIHPDMTMEELLQIYPGAQRALFTKYHIGGCSSCGFRPEETVAGVCQRNNNLPADEVIEHLLQSYDQDEAMQIDPEELQELLQQESPPAVVDIRTREEWDVGHLAQARLFSQELMQEMLGTWEKSSPIIFYDHQGQRSMDAAAFFAGHGFTGVKSLRGGIDAWSSGIDPSIPRYEVEL